MQKLIIYLLLVTITHSYCQELNLPVFTQQLADNNIEVSPNPFDEQTIVTLTDILSGTYNYSIVDITGKQVLKGSMQKRV